MTVDVAVVGGGISGLAAAHDLVRRGYRVVVLERQARLGGKAFSERIGGFLMEHGPSSVDGGSAHAQALSSELGLDRHRLLLGPGVRHRYLLGGGALRGIPVHPFGFLTSPYLPVAARLRLLAEAALPRGREGHEESVAEFCARRFGAVFLERVIDPLVGGMFAARPEALSVAGTFPRLVELEREHGSILRGALAARLRGQMMPGRILSSWRGGIATLPQVLAARLGSAVHTGIAVRSLARLPRGFRIGAAAAGTIEAKAVVLATQPHVTAALLEGLDDEGAGAASRIAAPPIAVVFLGYARQAIAHPLDGIGYLAPSAEGSPLLGALFCSTMFANRAPTGHVALAGYIGGDRAPETARLPPEELIETAHAEFTRLLGARARPVVARVRQWHRGLPQYRLGHRGLCATLADAEARNPGLFVTGNFISGLAVAACLRQAVRTGERVGAFLSGLAGDSGGRGQGRRIAV